MSLNVSLDLPAAVEERLRRESASLDADVKEAVVLELFRRGRLSHFEISQVLGLDRYETDAFLQRHRVWDNSLAMEDLESDRQTLERLMEQSRQ